MKNNAILRIVIWSLVILILVSILLTVLAFRGFTSIKRTNITESDSGAALLPAGLQLNIPGNEVRDLKIQWVSGSIIIEPADVDEIQISESAPSDPKYTMVCKHSGDRLTVSFCEDARLDFHFGISINDIVSKNLTILVPKDWQCDELQIEAASATLDVKNLTIRNVNFDGASGTCNFTDCTVDTLDLDTASGDVTFTGSLDVLDCDAASASVYATLNNVPSKIDMDSMSGDLDITLPADAGFTLSMDAMSSDFVSDFETTIRNGNYVSGDGACRIDVDAMSGDVSLRKAQ